MRRLTTRSSLCVAASAFFGFICSHSFASLFGAQRTRECEASNVIPLSTKVAPAGPTRMYAKESEDDSNEKASLHCVFPS